MDEPSKKLQNLKSLNSLPAAGGVAGAGQGRFGVRGRFGWTKKKREEDEMVEKEERGGMQWAEKKERGRCSRKEMKWQRKGEGRAGGQNNERR
ncbi:hypothetical protein COP1_007176 [Malus domestica]